LLKLYFVKAVNYGSSSARTENELPEDGVTVPKHVGAILM